MCEDDYRSVMRNGRTIDRSVVALPILFELGSVGVHASLEGACIQLVDVYSNPVSKLQIECVFEGENEAMSAWLSESPESELVFVGGSLFDFRGIQHRPFESLRYRPANIKVQLEASGARAIAVLVPCILADENMRAVHELLRSTKAVIQLHVPVNSGAEYSIPYPVRVRCLQAITKSQPFSEYADRIRVVLLPWYMQSDGDRDMIYYMKIAKNYGASEVMVVGRNLGDIKGVFIFSSEIGINPINWPSQTNSTENSVKNLVISGIPMSSDLFHPSAVSILQSYFPELWKRGLVIMLVGLSGSGKSTLATSLKQRLEDDFSDRRVSLIDGDEMRAIFSRDLSFTASDRQIHLERMGIIASQIAFHRGVAIVSTMAPKKQARMHMRSTVRGVSANFFLIHVDTSLETCIQRDTKGLYRKAKEGRIETLVGIHEDFEEPTNEEADLVVSSSPGWSSPENVVDIIVSRLIERRFIRPNSSVHAPVSYSFLISDTVILSVCVTTVYSVHV